MCLFGVFVFKVQETFLKKFGYKKILIPSKECSNFTSLFQPPVCLPFLFFSSLAPLSSSKLDCLLKSKKQRLKVVLRRFLIQKTQEREINPLLTSPFSPPKIVKTQRAIIHSVVNDNRPTSKEEGKKRQHLNYLQTQKKAVNNFDVRNSGKGCEIVFRSVLRVFFHSRAIKLIVYTNKSNFICTKRRKKTIKRFLSFPSSYVSCK